MFQRKLFCNHNFKYNIFNILKFKIIYKPPVHIKYKTQLNASCICHPISELRLVPPIPELNVPNPSVHDKTHLAIYRMECFLHSVIIFYVHGWNLYKSLSFFIIFFLTFL